MDSKNMVKSFTRIAAFALVVLFLHPASFAETNYVAKTAKQVDISTQNLSSMLLPLTQSELLAEAAEWQGVLSRKVEQVSNLEIKHRKAKQQADQTANPDAKASADLEQKIALMRVEQGSINKRFEIVLDSLEAKGGDVNEQRLYLSAVSGVKLKVDNTGAILTELKEWMRADDGGQLLLVNILKFVAAIVLVVLLARLLGRLTDRLLARHPTSLLLQNFVKVAVRRMVLVIGLIAALPIIGVNIGPVLALIGAAGLVVGLALQGTLSNFASGVLILIYRPYDMGDAITVSDVSGSVSGMNLLSTTIKTFDNQLITIPNNNVWNGAIINITGSDERRIDMVFGIGYGDDFGKAQEILQSVLAQHPMVLETPEPKIRMHELADSSVNLICRPWSKTADYWDVYWDVTESVKREFDKQGISIPFPQRDVHFHPVAGLPESGDKTA